MRACMGDRPEEKDCMCVMDNAEWQCVCMHAREEVSVSVWNDTYGITRIPTTVAGARGCEKSRINNQHKDRLPRFGPRGCVKP